MLIDEFWRRRGDSNPRYAYTYASFQDRYIYPYPIDIKDIIVTVGQCVGQSSEMYSSVNSGGEGGIRTPGTLTRTLVFKTSTFNHSVTSPTATEHSDFL